MIHASFSCPSSIDEAVGMLAEEGARPIAGGTDLLLRTSKGADPPERLISLHAVEELRSISIDGDVLRFGAAVTLATLADSREIEDLALLLTRAARSMASPPVRSRGTIGGNLCNASPAADLAPPLLVHEAVVELVGPDGARKLPLSDFLVGPGETALSPGELLTAVEVPLLPRGALAAHLKHQTGTCANLSIISVAVALTLDDDDVCADARIALGAVAPTAVRVPEVERILAGARIDAKTLDRAGAVAGSQCSPIDDVRATCDHRCHLVSVLLPRAIRAALNDKE